MVINQSAKTYGDNVDSVATVPGEPEHHLLLVPRTETKLRIIGSASPERQVPPSIPVPPVV
eukprot:1615696-Heterocapsa_arctica.AAC.1